MTGHTDCNTRKSKGKAICDAPTLKVELIDPYIEEKIRSS
jgi:hypothetical protein